MIWLVVGAGVWALVAIPVGIVIGRSMALADQPSPATETPARHLHLVS